MTKEDQRIEQMMMKQHYGIIMHNNNYIKINNNCLSFREALLKWKRNADIKHNNGAVANGCFFCSMHACHGML